jgi:hypothetical protein
MAEIYEYGPTMAMFYFGSKGYMMFSLPDTGERLPLILQLDAIFGNVVREPRTYHSHN